MTHSTGQQFPNETYLNGLRDNPVSTLAVVYDEFRMSVIRAVRARGGMETDGAAAFQLAVNYAVQQSRIGSLSSEIPFGSWLQKFSLAFFELSREEPGVVEEGPTAQDTGDATEISESGEIEIPDAEALLQTLHNARAWEQLEHLEPGCQQILLKPGTEPVGGFEPELETNSDLAASCRESYAQRLDPDSESKELPAWAEAALQDREGYAVWQRTQELEEEWRAGVPAVPESNRIWRWAVGIFLAVAVGYGLYQFYFRPKTAAEVFADNFAPPTSLLDDMKKRYGAEMGNDSSGAQPNECLLLLREADAYYQANKYDEAEQPLMLLVLDSSSICQSDAWFYLGLIQLKREEPASAIQCFAKIEDLQRYGEDVYWYQALAFVQLAKENPLLRDKARRAVERTLGHTRDPKRRQQAEKMRQNLAQ